MLTPRALHLLAVFALGLGLALAAPRRGAPRRKMLAGRRPD